MLDGPGNGLVQIEHDGHLLLFRAGPFIAQPIAGFGAGPFRALMGELERAIVVDRGDQVAIVFGQLKGGQVADAVPTHRADNDLPRGIGGADYADCLTKHPVPLFGREVFVWFVEELEGQFGRIVLIMLGNLPPQGEESLAMLVGIVKDFLVVVHVHHGNKMAF